MNEQLKKALELALKNKGLKEGLSKFIQVEKEEDIETAIADYIAVSAVEVLTPEQMIELPTVKSKIDSKITGAVKTNTENLSKKFGFDPTKEPNNPNPQPKDDDMPSWAKQILDDNKELKTKLENFQTEKTVEQKRADALSKLKASTVIPDSFKDKWGNRIDVNSETSFEDQIKSLETEYTELEQSWANEKGYAGNPGSGGATGREITVEEAADVFGKVNN